MPTLTKPRAEPRLASVQRADAWRDYLLAVQAAPSASYDEVEAWAWSRLRDRLRKIAGNG